MWSGEMTYRNAHLAEGIAGSRLEELRQQTETRRLVHEAQTDQQVWVARQGRWLLGQAARILLAAGRRLERQGLPQTSLVEG